MTVLTSKQEYIDAVSAGLVCIHHSVRPLCMLVSVYRLLKHARTPAISASIA